MYLAIVDGWMHGGIIAGWQRDAIDYVLSVQVRQDGGWYRRLQGSFGRRLRKDETSGNIFKRGVPVCGDYLAGMWGSGVADCERVC